MNYLKLTNHKLDINLINDLVVHESCGAVSFFAGTTRDNFEEKTVVSLQYEAYESMALKSMEKICSEIRAKWTDIKNIAIYHRLDTVPVKEASVIIAISSPHRQASLEAVQYAINELKKNVPIWKKEEYSDSAEKCNGIKESNTAINKIKEKSRKPLNYDDCYMIPDVTDNLIQIHADDPERKRRMNCCLDKKREENDISNIQDFIEIKDEGTESDREFSCARLNSSIFKCGDSNSYLKVYRIKNEYGPQTQITYTKDLDKQMEAIVQIKQEQPLQSNVPDGIKERLENTEKFLNISSSSSVPKNIYQRLKDVEDRILKLETISPEFGRFLPNSGDSLSNVQQLAEPKKIQKKTYSIIDLNNYIKDFKRKKLTN